MLQRRESEWIDITTADGTRIEVCVVEIRKAGGDKPKARLGFVAPKNVTVHRREVSIRIAADKELDRDDQG